MIEKVMIWGITGQVGSYLAEMLLEQGYEVHGVIRRSSNFNTERIDHIFSKLNLHYGDVIDATNVSNLVNKIKPKWIFNLSAQSVCNCLLSSQQHGNNSKHAQRSPI